MSNEWLDTRRDIREGQKIKGKVLREFVKNANVAAVDVLEDDDLMMVVTISSNSELLKNHFNCAHSSMMKVPLAASRIVVFPCRCCLGGLYSTVFMNS